MNFRPALLPCLGLMLLSPIARAQPTTNSSDAADAKAAATACLTAIVDGDLPTALAHMSGDPAEAESAKIISGVFDANRTLRKSMEAKFGAASVGTSTIMMDPKQARAAIAKMEATVDGDTAALKGPGQSRSEVNLKKIGGEWKVVALTGDRAEGRAELAKMMPPLVAAFKSTAAEIDAGQYASATEANAAVTTKINGAMMGNRATSMPATQPAG